MDEPTLRTGPPRSDPSLRRTPPDWALLATMARADEWSSDRVVDPGDNHVKGEASLCVGEAA